MTTSELVDKGYKLDKRIKELTAELEAIKETLKGRALATKSREFLGEQGKAVVGDRATTTIKPEVLISYLKDSHMEERLPDLINVKVDETRKLLGEMVIDEIASKGVSRFSIVRFTPR